VSAIEKANLNVHSLMVLRHGQVVAEGWWAPYAPQFKHTLYSLSKSFTSTAVGMAVAEGKLTVDDKVISFFKADLPATISDNLAAMRVKDLLTMTTGHDKEPTPSMRADGNKNWIRAFSGSSGRPQTRNAFRIQQWRYVYALGYRSEA
jgi:CubicO group peptidase (beta-lactamase class C family)